MLTPQPRTLRADLVLSIIHEHLGFHGVSPRSRELVSLGYYADDFAYCLYVRDRKSKAIIWEKRSQNIHEFLEEDVILPVMMILKSMGD